MTALAALLAETRERGDERRNYDTVSELIQNMDLVSEGISHYLITTHREEGTIVDTIHLLEEAAYSRLSIATGIDDDGPDSFERVTIPFQRLLSIKRVWDRYGSKGLKNIVLSFDGPDDIPLAVPEDVRGGRQKRLLDFGLALDGVLVGGTASP